MDKGTWLQSGESQESDTTKQLRTHTQRYRYVDIYLHVCIEIIHTCERMCEQQRGFPGGSKGKASAYSAGDPGSTPALGGSSGRGNGNPLQYSCLENPMDGGAW